MGSLVSPRQRHLKWPALDWLEAVLFVVGGVCIIGFSLSVLIDIVTRQIGYPWLWLQQLTTGSFAYGVFIGMALACRRNDHIYLTEITGKFSGSLRIGAEVFGRVVVLAVALCLVVFGWINTVQSMESFRMPSLIPMGYYAGIIPVSGALIALFQCEQIVNGLRHGFPDRDEPLEVRP